jgi:hypothetical protein
MTQFLNFTYHPHAALPSYIGEREFEEGSEKKELFYIFTVVGFPLLKDLRSHMT